MTPRITFVFCLALAASPLRSELLAQRSTPESRETARLVAVFPAETNDALERALQFLDDQQNGDGSWGSLRTEMTALALLAYLGNGITPISPERGDRIIKALKFLIDQSAEGKGTLGRRDMPHFPWVHGIATLALLEGHLIGARSGVKSPELAQSCQVAVQWIIDNQHRDGGWANEYESEGQLNGDPIFNVVSLHALLLAHEARIETRNRGQALKRGFAYLAKLRRPEGWFFSTPRSSMISYPTTGGSAFVFQLGAQPPDFELSATIGYLSTRDDFAYQGKVPASRLKPLHYEALAMKNDGGEGWRTWAAQRIPELLLHQQRDGSFPTQREKDYGSSIDDPIEHTALACLILESPWRYHLSK